VNPEIERRLAAEAVANSPGYVTDGQSRQVLVVGCASIEIPFPWWAVGEEVSVPSHASVSELLEAAPAQDG
jgi:hypothetical protein